MKKSSSRRDSGFIMTIAKTLRQIQEKLSSVSGDFARSEAERILTFLFECSRSELYLSLHEKLPPVIRDLIDAIVNRRLKDEPLAYILGSVYFYNKEFLVSPDVLIPRPDTEILVEQVLKNEPAAGDCRFLDLGTGCGCIAAILTGQNPQWKAVASDISVAALKIAQKNCPKGILLLCADRLTAIKKQLDFIVCNPPYIASSVLPTLEKSVCDFEPLRALDGGQDGLDFYRYLATTAKPLLRPRGRIYCEIGYNQGKEVPAIFKKKGWRDIRVVKDNAGHPRVVRAEKGKT
jgi:release factor glutamine methyltransferase